MPVPRISIFRLLLLTITLSQNFAYGVPLEMSYAGHLSAGGALPSTVALRISFWSAASGGTSTSVTLLDSAWVPLSPANTYSSVEIPSGDFEVILRMTSADYHGVFPNSTSSPWIQVELVTVSGSVATPAQVFPRQKFTTVPYALKIPIDTAKLAFDANGLLTLSETLYAKFQGNQTGTQNIACGVYTTLSLNSEAYDTANAFASNTFTPTQPGYYSMGAQAYVSGYSGESAFYSLSICQVGGGCFSQNMHSANGSGLTLNVSGQFTSSGTNSFIAQAYQSRCPSATYIQGSFWGHRIP